MVFFLGFLVFATIVLPAFPLSRFGRLALSLAFCLTLIFGVSAVIRQRFVICLVVGLTGSAFVVDRIAQSETTHALGALDLVLKLACLSILLFVTLQRTLRPGLVTVYRVIGGIAGYLLIGYLWSFGYQLLDQLAPGAIHFESGDAFSLEVSRLTYFSFMTLTTVGYGDVHPVHPIARSLAVAEALVGQLYIAILISSLVGMALQAKVGGRNQLD